MNGGYEGVRRVPSMSNSTGQWSDAEQHLARLAELWPATPCRYLRVNVTALNGDGYLEMADVRFYVGATTYPTVNMTSDTAPSPLVASTNSNIVPGTTDAYTAFDSSPTVSRWHSNNPAPPIWLQIDLGAGNEIAPTGIHIIPLFGGGFNRTPSAFEVLGSNTGSFSGEQTTFYSVSGLTTGWSAGVQRTFSW